MLKGEKIGKNMTASVFIWFSSSFVCTKAVGNLKLVWKL